MPRWAGSQLKGWALLRWQGTAQPAGSEQAGQHDNTPCSSGQRSLLLLFVTGGTALQAAAAGRSKAWASKSKRTSPCVPPPHPPPPSTLGATCPARPARSQAAPAPAGASCSAGSTPGARPRPLPAAGEQPTAGAGAPTAAQTRLAACPACAAARWGRGRAAGGRAGNCEPRHADAACMVQDREAGPANGHGPSRPGLAALHACQTQHPWRWQLMAPPATLSVSLLNRHASKAHAFLATHLACGYCRSSCVRRV